MPRRKNIFLPARERTLLRGIHCPVTHTTSSSLRDPKQDSRLGYASSYHETAGLKSWLVSQRHKIPDLCMAKVNSTALSRPKNSNLSQNAVAGGLAGGIVSCCLHPIDTLKTILQANRGGQRALLPNVVKIVQERGAGGLYKGLGANLTTAAPISAIYASTYEAVKELLIPHLPKEWTAVAHCVAGGAASVATAVVYTPSEAVKQRLQIGCQYKSSWGALVGMMRSEGVGSLYTGLGAVLCRNVPQSIIKFWTYEALKHWALQGDLEQGRLRPGTQLVIGGAAGSTAALFTTPFDVIKTRLQTQVPRGLQYRGVAHAFRRIWMEEGLAGLYRGLAARLVIYMSQGAIFFASYELLKRLLYEPSHSARVSQAMEEQRRAPKEERRRLQ